ncbi:MAG: COX15/CtaA family protein [Terracoccus sp.]
MSVASRLPGWIPRAPAAWARPILIANLVGEIGIVVTGGVVRLTGSGLGCPTWPECVPGSVTPVRTDASQYHDLIEFGNRTLTGVVGILALASIWVVLTRFPDRGRLHLLAFGVLGGIIAQGIVGGIAVLTGLNPWIVMAHFLVSMVLVTVSTALVHGARPGPVRPSELVVHPLARRLAQGTAAVGALVIVLGTVVTGSGPHSGDALTPARTGFDPRFVSWMHADLVMFFSGLVIATLVAVRLTSSSREAKRAWDVVLGVTLLQGVIGYAQYFTGLPIVLVALHMLGACLLVVALTRGVLTTRGDAGDRSGAAASDATLANHKEMHEVSASRSA